MRTKEIAFNKAKKMGCPQVYMAIFPIYVLETWQDVKATPPLLSPQKPEQ